MLNNSRALFIFFQKIHKNRVKETEMFRDIKSGGFKKEYLRVRRLFSFKEIETASKLLHGFTYEQALDTEHKNKVVRMIMEEVRDIGII